MNRQSAKEKHQQKPTVTAVASGALQRKCDCGNHTIVGGQCEECGKKKRIGMQTKLKVNEPGDTYEQEADRIADQVMATQAHPAVRDALPRIQRHGGQATGQIGPATASVDHVLAGPGRPLEPELRQDMERCFGYDFSQVRVHSGATAEQSAQDVNAHAYTVGHNVVFGAGQFAPGTDGGRRLIAHELTHVVQSGKESSQLNRQTIYRQLDHAQIAAEIQILRMQLMAPVNPLRPVQQARLIQLEAMLNRTGGRSSQPAPPKPKPYLDMPFMFRFSKAWNMAKEAVLQEVRKNDKAYHDGSISRGLIEVKNLVPNVDAVWKAGIYGGLFKNDERDLVDENAGKMASDSYGRRYKAARYGHIYGDERTYESSGRRRDDDTEIWSRGREYGLFLPDEKARVLNISAIGVGRAVALNSLAKTADPKSPDAARLMDEIHNFTKDPAVVLLGPEIEKLFGSYGYKYRDEADQWFVADAINKAYAKSLQPNQILRDPGATVAQRWDECQRRRGAGSNNLEAAQFDRKCFQSEDEFKTEFAHRENEYHQRFKDCGHSRPSHFKCRDKVMSTYYPGRWALYDAAARWAYNNAQIAMPVLREGGPVGGFVFHATHEWLGWSTGRSADAANLASGVSNLAGAKLTQVHSNRTAGQSVTPSDEMTPPPEHVASAPGRDPVPLPGKPSIPPAGSVVAPYPLVTPDINVGSDFKTSIRNNGAGGKSGGDTGGGGSGWSGGPTYRPDIPQNTSVMEFEDAINLARDLSMNRSLYIQELNRISNIADPRKRSNELNDFIKVYSHDTGIRIELVPVTSTDQISQLGLTGGNWGTYKQSESVIYMRADVLQQRNAVNEIGHEVGAAELYRIHGLPKDSIPLVLGNTMPSGGNYLTHLIDLFIRKPE